MAEPIFMRVRRVISANVEDQVDRMERAGGVKVMNEAIREVDRIVDEVRSEREAAMARRLQAARQQRMTTEKLSALESKARFALGEDREDLAEAAITRQIELEGQTERLETIQTDSAEEEARLDECLTALANRKTEMEEALEAFNTSKRDASFGGDGAPNPGFNRERKVERAELAFDRAMGGTTARTSMRTEAKSAAKVAEIDVLQKGSIIAQRMAQLRETQKAA